MYRGGVQNQAEKNSKNAFRPVPVQKFTFPVLYFFGDFWPCGSRGPSQGEEDNSPFSNEVKASLAGAVEYDSEWLAGDRQRQGM